MKVNNCANAASNGYERNFSVITQDVVQAETKSEWDYSKKYKTKKGKDICQVYSGHPLYCEVWVYWCCFKFIVFCGTVDWTLRALDIIDSHFANRKAPLYSDKPGS